MSRNHSSRTTSARAAGRRVGPSYRRDPARVPGTPRSERTHVAIPDRSVRRAANRPEHRARLAQRITPRDRWLLAMLHEHRVLTSEQILRLAFSTTRTGTRRTCQLRLQKLFLWSVLDRFRPLLTVGSAPLHHVLGSVGIHLLANQHELEPKRLGYRDNTGLDVASTLFLDHTVGIADWFTDLIVSARDAAEPREVTAWWSEKRCAAHFGDLVRPDAYGRISAGSHSVRTTEFFLEYDNGTENPARLGRKLHGYHQLARSTGIASPVLFWFVNPGREPAARHHLARAHQGLDQPDLVPVATATPASGSDPFAPSWLALDHTARQAITHLHRAWPHLLADATTPTTGRSATRDRDQDQDREPDPSPSPRTPPSLLLPPVPPTPPAPATNLGAAGGLSGTKQ